MKMVKKVTYKTKSNRTISANLFLSSPDSPGVVLCHGFGISKKHFTIHEVASSLNIKGFNVLTFDFFGHGESGGNFNDITITKALEDAKTSINYLKSKINGKLGLFGSSFGGMIALLETARNPELSALTIFAAPADMGETHKLLDKEKIIKKHGEFGEKFIEFKEAFIKQSTNFFEDLKNYNVRKQAEKISIPTLFLHGDEDIIVPLSHTEELFQKIKGPKELQIIHGADHFLRDKDYLISIKEKTIEWFEKWL